MSELRDLERRMRALEAAMADGDDSVMAEYGELMTAFELRGGYDADARLEQALHGLGLGLVARSRTVGGLSGGEQVRLRLAAVLAAAPEVLLLDEPTNHLDDDALTWLEEHLRTRRGTTVAVSHDRVFLERVATSLLEVDADRRRVVRHGNGYSGFLAEQAAARQRWEQSYAQWQSEVARMRETAATTARQVAPGRAMRDNNKMAYDRAAWACAAVTGEPGPQCRGAAAPPARRPGAAATETVAVHADAGGWPGARRGARGHRCHGRGSPRPDRSHPRLGRSPVDHRSERRGQVHAAAGAGR